MKRNRRPTKYEQETSLLYNRAEPEATIFTYEPALKRRLAKYAAKHPEVAKLISADEDGAVMYEIDKRRVALRFTAPYSDERRKAASDLAKQNRIASRRNNHL